MPQSRADAKQRQFLRLLLFLQAIAVLADV